MSSFAIQPVAPSNVTQSEATARTGPAPAQAAPTAGEPQDTVKLTDSQQAETMYQSGDSVSSISSSLGVSESIVDSYLGIVPTVSVPTSVATPGTHSSTTEAQSTSAATTKPAAAKVDVKA